MNILFFDVDGTLVDSKTHEIPDSTIESIKNAQKKGNLCMISTGRHLYKLFELEKIDQINWDGYVLDNGSLIMDKNKNIISKHFLEKKQVHKIIEKCKSENMVCTLQLMNEIIAPLGYSKYLKSTYEFLNWKLEDDVRDYNNEEVIYAIIYNKINYDFNQFHEIKNIALYPNNSDYADINYINSSKANGIKELLNYLSLSNAETFCFGDSHNDIEMFKYIKTSIAMGNACSALKELASYITTDVNNNGIKRALEKYNLC